MRTVMVGLLLGTATLLLAPAAWAYNAYVVSDPADLQLVDMSEAGRYVSEQFANKFDILTDLRRAAGRKMMKGWGLRKSPDKAKAKLGIVADTSTGPLEFVCVVTGEDVDCSLLRSRMVEKYGNHWRRHKRTPAVREETVGGEPATVLPYMDRKGELILAVVNGHLLFASVLPGHFDLLERTMAVVKDPSLRKKAPPASVHLGYKGALSDDERNRVKEFFQRTVVGKVEKFRRGFEKLYQGLDAKEFDAKEFRSTNEKINDLYLKLIDWSADLQYNRGPNPKDDLYKVACSLRLPSDEDAQALKELLLEKILFYKENAAGKAGILAMDAVGLDASGPTVTIKAEIDSTEGAYNMFFAYYAFLLGYSQADRYMGIN
ncbi:MAG: hypothetical protein HY814_15630 [Candidatus Riflebacteria bacterium]|nr:hypothetical protein [Candidatus Riflebacteria bacterium]